MYLFFQLHLKALISISAYIKPPKKPFFNAAIRIIRELVTFFKHILGFTKVSQISERWYLFEDNCIGHHYKIFMTVFKSSN